MEVTKQGPKALIIRGFPRSSCGLRPQRDPEQSGAWGQGSHPLTPSLLAAHRWAGQGRLHLM